MLAKYGDTAEVVGQDGILRAVGNRRCRARFASFGRRVKQPAAGCQPAPQAGGLCHCILPASSLRAGSGTPLDTNILVRVSAKARGPARELLQLIVASCAASVANASCRNWSGYSPRSEYLSHLRAKDISEIVFPRSNAQCRAV